MTDAAEDEARLDEIRQEFLHKLRELIFDYEDLTHEAWCNLQIADEETINVKIRFGSDYKVWSWNGAQMKSKIIPYKSEAASRVAI